MVQVTAWRPRRTFNASLLALMLTGLMACSAGGDAQDGHSAGVEADWSLLPQAHAQVPGARGNVVSDVAEACIDSVVHISTSTGSRRSPIGSGLGSGVIIDPKGVILTNNHVVENARSILVTLNDGRKFDARVKGVDPKSDLAVIELEGNPRGLKSLKFGDSASLRLGEYVLAIGNPFGLSGSVTMGIVSAKGRANVGIVDYEDFIQTDAAINPGNSGGALVNLRGELVGINTAILSRSGGYQGIGFSIPSNMAKPIMESLVNDGRVRRGWLGISIEDVTPKIATELGMRDAKGVLVRSVQANSPAARAGLRRGDVVLKIKQEEVNSSTRLRNIVALEGAGASVTFTIFRDGATKALRIQLGELPE